MTGQRFRPLAVVVFVCVVALSAPLVLARSGSADGPKHAPRGSGIHADALLVRFAAGTSAASIKAVLDAGGAVEVGRLDQLNTRVVVAANGRTRDAVGSALRTDPKVVAVEADGPAHVTLTPDDPLWAKQWSARKVRADRAWNVTIGTAGPIVAVLDTGVQASQPDLVGRVLPGFDFVNNDDNAADDNGHGTKVAGVVTAQGMNATGVAGMCWDCRILPVKVAGSDGNVAWSNAAAGVIWAADNGARIINMSFGKSTGTATMAAAVEYARGLGVFVIAAAGNEGNRARFYPAAYPGVMSVAATTESDGLYSWSTRGDWVRLAAPGCTWTTRKGASWDSFCGTSAAAPIVAGTAGLILAYKPEATAAEIEAAILDTAVSVTTSIGGGRLDSYSAVHKFEPKPGNGKPDR